MFSMWYSGDARARYRATSHEARIDRMVSRLVQHRYLDDAIRHHLHEWLRFTDYPWAAHGRTGNGPHGEGGVGVTLGHVARCGDAGRRKQGTKSG